jgi:hypothetical protein
VGHAIVAHSAIVVDAVGVVGQVLFHVTEALQARLAIVIFTWSDFRDCRCVLFVEVHILNCSESVLDAEVTNHHHLSQVVRRLRTPPQNQPACWLPESIHGGLVNRHEHFRPAATSEVRIEDAS